MTRDRSEACDTTTDIAIVGGGICGLTTAIALEQRGWEPSVYEAATEYRPIGAGLLLQTNALLVLERLGLADRVRAAGTPLGNSAIRSPDGRVLKRFDLDRIERTEFGYGFVAIHRADLQQILLDELDATVQTGMECERVIGTDSPTAKFSDGTRISPDVLVGADGIHSAVRDAVVSDVDLQSVDGVCYRSVVSVELPDRHRDHGLEVWGDGSYTGGAPLDDDRFYWFATVSDSTAAGLNGSQEVAAALRERFAAFPEPIPVVLDALDPDDIFATGLEDVPALDRWSRGSVVLAGDAAHGMLPFAGQGAAQSIEDALALADAIDRHPEPAAAFASYEAERRQRADGIRAEAHRLGRLGTVQSPFAARLRNLAIGLVPASLFRRFRRQRAARTSLPDRTLADGGPDA
ncbi:2-polyprenyl-6-methoxyphenol hydroxylase [Natronoarchaeum philippinense]|uniref:2-polyprenyl-6-methoxyphenol hydroxylase n=1 Tax=Natronoarchaeum philippinense TaxID=558529 RepID=A0A285NT21_NATPI|nr:FAD-dependent monooxygenase [Natronoarchaeum philippinense]SNZ12615.1 2-polyprenyl-6-methoxyphenol hydroxylase [Natronoarchaeum philippinense]